MSTRRATLQDTVVDSMHVDMLDANVHIEDHVTIKKGRVMCIRKIERNEKGQFVQGNLYESRDLTKQSSYEN